MRAALLSIGPKLRKRALRNALAAGMAGFKGTAEEFLARQAALYSFAKEGDARLKTWLSAETLKIINATLVQGANAVERFHREVKAAAKTIHRGSIRA